MLPFLIKNFAATTCSHSFFFLPSWWEYLPTQPSAPNCNITFVFPGDIWLVGLAILDMLLRLAGFVAVVSIIVAGIGYIMAGGNSEKGASARKRLTNSLIGLAIAMIAALVVSFIGKTLGG